MCKPCIAASGGNEIYSQNPALLTRSWNSQWRPEPTWELALAPRMVNCRSLAAALLVWCACLLLLQPAQSLPSPNHNLPSQAQSRARMQVKTVHEHEAAVGVSASALVAAAQAPPLYTKFFPIFPHELVKFFTLSSMMFFIVFIFTMTRDTKDALIVTNCGAEAIAFLKVYGVVPAAALFMVVYANLANRFDPRTLFYLTVSPFMAFYSLFAFVLYPMRERLHPMHIALPLGGMSYPVNLLRHWTFSLYYIVSELWGSAGVPLLFWACANDVVKIDQARRIYPLIALVGNLGPIFSGLTMTSVSAAVARRIGDEDKAFEVTLKVLTACMLGAGVMIGLLHWLVHRINDADLAQTQAQTQVGTQTQKAKTDPQVGNAKAKKSRPGLLDSLRVLAADDYLRSICTMVLSYGLTMEFTEIIWKSCVKRAFPQKSEYLSFMGRYSTMVGSASFFMMFVGANLVKNLGWRAGALLTPTMMALFSMPFFVSIVKGVDSQRALKTAVYVGLVNNVLSKATKYAVFDPTKEMTYIPLEKDAKTKGKAAIDVLGARVGKSGGALVQQGLVLVFGSIVQGAPVLALLFYGVIFMWIGAVNKLAPLFAEKSGETTEPAKTQPAKSA